MAVCTHSGIFGISEKEFNKNYYKIYYRFPSNFCQMQTYTILEKIPFKLTNVRH